LDLSHRTQKTNAALLQTRHQPGDRVATVQHQHIVRPQRIQGLERHLALRDDAAPIATAVEGAEERIAHGALRGAAHGQQRADQARQGQGATSGKCTGEVAVAGAGGEVSAARDFPSAFLALQVLWARCGAPKGRYLTVLSQRPANTAYRHHTVN
jgi:hypothetical protein